MKSIAAGPLSLQSPRTPKPKSAFKVRTPGKESIWEMQIFAGNRRFSQEPVEKRRDLQKTADWRLSP